MIQKITLDFLTYEFLHPLVYKEILKGVKAGEFQIYVDPSGKQHYGADSCKPAWKPFFLVSVHETNSSTQNVVWIMKTFSQSPVSNLYVSRGMLNLLKLAGENYLKAYKDV